MATKPNNNEYPKFIVRWFIVSVIGAGLAIATSFAGLVMNSQTLVIYSCLLGAGSWLNISLSLFTGQYYINKIRE